MIPSAKDWAVMRSIVTAYFPDVVSIYSVTVSGQTRYGDTVISSGLIATVSGQLSSPTGREQNLITALARQGVLAEETMMLTLPYGTPIDQSYTVVTSGNVQWNVVHTTRHQTFSATTQAVITRRTIGPLAEVNNE